MKNFIYSFFTVILLICSSSPLFCIQVEPEIVARVNGDPVTLIEYKRMLENPLTRLQLQQELGVTDPGEEELKKLAFQKVVHYHLLLQEANRQKVSVTEKEIDEAVKSLRERFGDLKDFGMWMKQQEIDDRSLFETIKAELITNRVFASLVKEVKVEEEQLRDYYETHKKELIIGEEVRLRIIAVKEKDLADEILTSLKNGDSFSRLAQERSAGLRAGQGGDTGWIDIKSLPEPLHKAVPHLKPGDVAGPLERAPSEFLIVALEARRPIIAKNLADAREEIKRRLLPAEQKRFVKAWLKQQEKNSKIESFLK